MEIGLSGQSPAYSSMRGKGFLCAKHAKQEEKEMRAEQSKL